MQLKDLVGEHVLDIVPKTDIRHPLSADAAGVLFMLSGNTYLAFEDENDGYRSSLGAILSFDGGVNQLGASVWWPEYINEAVLCSHTTQGEYGGEDDVLEVRSKETGKIVLRVGTTNVDDYYPSYICQWSPESLSANARERVS